MTLVDKMHHPPVVRDRFLKLGLEQSIIIPARSTWVVRLPLQIDQTVEYKDLGTMPKGVILWWSNKSSTIIDLTAL